MDAETVRVFQSCNGNHCGLSLKQDGVLGQQTRWAMDLATLHQDRQRLIRLAQRHYGLKETGKNDDPRGLIREWVTRCGCKPGDPWCASWASWVLSEVLGKSLRIGGALRLARVFPITTRPIAGDLFAYPVGDEGHGHIGFVSGSDAVAVMTLEANHDDMLGSWRRPLEGLTFYRTIDDTSGTPPGVIPTLPFLTPRGGKTR
jgi:CHAP domain